VLHRLIAAGRVAVEVDVARLDSLGSPVSKQSDLAKWFVLLVAVAGAAFWFAGAWVGLGVTAIGLALYQGLGRPHLRRQLVARVSGEALAEDGLWRQLWRFGGVTLVSRDPARPGRCAAPDGDWIGFARQLDSGIHVESGRPNG
jgi:hypothetical protein